jgi:SAM-dependent methyltransferase
MAKLGFFVHGVDISEPMLELARQRSVRSGIAMDQVAWSLGDVRSFREPRQFDAVLALFHVASYQTTNDDLARFLATAARHLRSGGVVIFDFWYGPAVLAMQPSQRVKRVETDDYHLIRLAVPELNADANCVDVRYTLVASNKEGGDTEVIEETHRMRYLFIAETEKLLTEAGLTVTRFEEWLSADGPSIGTWSVVAVATK